MRLDFKTWKKVRCRRISIDIEKVLKEKFEEEKEKVSEEKVKKILNNVFKKIEEEEKRKS